MCYSAYMLYFILARSNSVFLQKLEIHRMMVAPVENLISKVVSKRVAASKSFRYGDFVSLVARIRTRTNINRPSADVLQQPLPASLSGC